MRRQEHSPPLARNMVSTLDPNAKPQHTQHSCDQSQKTINESAHQEAQAAFLALGLLRSGIFPRHFLF